jgi:hypothetical protein
MSENEHEPTIKEIISERAEYILVIGYVFIISGIDKITKLLNLPEDESWELLPETDTPTEFINLPYPDYSTGYDEAVREFQSRVIRPD